jgi:hypothetical protein
MLTAGFGTRHVGRHDADRLTALIGWKFQNSPQRPFVINRGSPRREAANGCRCAPVSALTGTRAESVKRVANCAVSTDTPRIQYRVVQSLGGNTAWIDGIGHLICSPANRLVAKGRFDRECFHRLVDPTHARYSAPKKSASGAADSARRNLVGQVHRRAQCHFPRLCWSIC